jgi:hypothetical protein
MGEVKGSHKQKREAVDAMSETELAAAAARGGLLSNAMIGVTGSRKQKREAVDAMSDKQLAAAAARGGKQYGGLPRRPENKGKKSAFNRFFNVDNNKENNDGARRLQATLKLSLATAKKVYAHVKRPGLRPSSMSAKQIKAFYETFCKDFPKFTTDMC